MAVHGGVGGRGETGARLGNVMRFLSALIPCLALAQLAQPAQPGLAEAYRRNWAPRLQPLLSELIRFPTVAGNDEARSDQQAWLLKVGKELGFAVRPAGKVTEVELPGPAGSPVLGLVVHGDVQPVDDHWSIPPFEGAVKEGAILGRGAADDKGPLVQALLAMRTLADSGLARTHTVRLLVGSDEESDNLDFKEYLVDHQAPDLSLVLDSAFPVVVGEKAWVGYWLDAPLASRGPAGGLEVIALDAGLSPSIVPDRATLTMRVPAGIDLEPLRTRLAAKPSPAGTRLEAHAGPDRTIAVTAFGRAAHGGINLEVGRNALVALARAMEGELPPGGADDLLAWIRLAGKDIHGSSLDLPGHPIFGPTTVNPATLKRQENGSYRLFINLRANPTLGIAALRAHLDAKVEAYNATHGAKLLAGGWFEDEVLAFDPNGKLVRRLLAAYGRATGRTDPPAISGGGTYAKRIPNAIAFGAWFPGKPYPGHDVDEKVELTDLHLGVAVLLEALADLACGAPLKEPFKP
ncbi:MAG TPA: Sapep family Mn(2+)-dependent dipeptidase [Anaeromyxobacteraceae bacterium]|nr:Sapep family Mn(2+)-dependent dipeptidase [Anaeromyxobacteraceae bacterium]